ncbi:MAG TPA: OmpA family protein [Sedimentisphaerales bacterium]|nr:OmpA family protein [Sedimentisphaerales bacterium]
MQTVRVSVFCVLCAGFVLAGGCASDQVKQLQVQNSRQADIIKDLQSKLDAAELTLGQLQAKLKYAESTGSVDVETLRNELKALEEDLQKKKDLIARMQQQMLGGVRLPVELSTMLEDFARTNPDMITYDAEHGIVKFKSDLLFDKGSDVVASSASEAVKTLCTILNSDTGKEFDVIIAGHTDDIPISKPETRAKHPTNWHLSAHRAISVLNVMGADGIDNTRMSVRGFGEFRPVVPNAPGKKGNAQNRRVEIYIVPRGM